jgi:hypothetical protein
MLPLLNDAIIEFWGQAKKYVGVEPFSGFVFNAERSNQSV